MNKFFPEMKKNLGFGLMRLPMNGENVDLEHTSKMVDAFLDAGFNYFDTAHGYIQGQSEKVVKACLSSRYSRDSYLLADKLTGPYFEKEEDIRPLIESQLDICGVTYFDFFLMHSMNTTFYEKFLKTNAFDVVQQMKAEGKLRHVGMSFHDSPAVLDRILTERPEMEFVQLQFNYVDYEDLHVQSRACYEICRKHGKPVFVMEPVKGGSLVNLPQQALDLMEGKNPAEYALRFAAGFEDIVMVLSGMSNMEQIMDNVGVMGDFQPLSEKEQEMISQVRTIYQAQHRIPCTACRYCTDGCPAGIDIPAVFAAANRRKSDDAQPDDGQILSQAANCVECGQCETVCPQQLSIRTLLQQIQK